jgi:hypothetical protein
MRREQKYVTRRVLNMIVERWRGKGQPEIKWINHVRQDMRMINVSGEMRTDRGEWKKKTCCVDP